MSYTNAALGTAFHKYPDAVGATIDPMGMIKIHFGGMPIFSGPGGKWASPPGGRSLELGLSELGGTPGFEASNAFIANPNYTGPEFRSNRGYRTTAEIQREAMAKTDKILAAQSKDMKTHPSEHAKDRALNDLGLPPQPESNVEADRSNPATVTPVEGLVGFRMAPREPVVPTTQTQAILMPSEPEAIPGRTAKETVGIWPTQADLDRQLREQNQNPPPKQDLVSEQTLEEILGLTTQGPPKMPPAALLKNLVLALDIGFNGTKDLKKMREAIAAMADAVRKGAIGD